MQRSIGGDVALVMVLTVVMAISMAPPSAAQAPVAHGTPGPETGGPASPRASLPSTPYTSCPVSLEAASAIVGVPMRPNPMYETPDGSLYAEHSPRMPGGEDETTVYTCAYLSADGIPPDRKLFLQFSVGDSAAWLWELNGPGIVDGGSYQAIVDPDPTAVDVYRTTDFFAADGQAFPLPEWQADRYLHGDQLFAHVIVSAAGDQVRAEQVETMASFISLALAENSP